jgi:putative inorganic carbon (hco3(-)) transporter
MVDVAVPLPRSHARLRARGRWATTFLAAMAAGVLAIISARAVGEGSKAAVVMPLAVGFGLVLVRLALSNFTSFVMLMLVIRSSVDLAKLSGAAAGTTESVGARSVDPSSLLSLVFIAAAAMWLLGEYRRTGLPGSRLRLAFTCFVVAGFISVIGSAHVWPSGMEAMRITSAVTMFIVLEQLARRPGGFQRILLAVYASSLFPLAYTAYGLATGHGRYKQEGTFTRTLGVFSQSNDFGRYLMLLIVMGVALLPHLHRLLRWTMVGIVAVSSVFMLLTYTRSALIGTVIGVMIVGWFQNKRIIIGLMAAGIVVLAVMPSAGTRYTELGTSGPGNSLTWRLNYWTDVLPLANKNPVTGIGLGETQYETQAQKQPHNDFLRAYVETGVMGLGAYLAVAFSIVSVTRRAVRKTTPKTFEYGLAVGAFGVAVAFVVVSAVANVLSSVSVVWYLYAFAAMGAVLASRPTRTNSPNAPAMQVS